MPLRRTWRRVRHFQGLVSEVARRDLRVRRIHAGDSALPAAPGTRPVTFHAAVPVGPRALPARPVPLRTPRGHADALVAEIRKVLAAHGIGWAEIPEQGTATCTFALRQSDWATAGALISRTLDHTLLGAGPAAAQPSQVPYASTVAPEDLTDQEIAYVLFPAVTMHEGSVWARYGFECAVRIERWDPDPDPVAGGRYSCSRWNPRTEFLEEAAFSTQPPRRDTAAAGITAVDVEPENPLAPLLIPPLTEVGFPIDVVYTWVDGTDPAWLRRKREAMEADSGTRMTENAASDLRFVGHDELRHSLRSLEQYAPWVRHVYLVTDRQRPPWLREDHPRLTVVDHVDITPEGTRLPTFNSQAIEANLHRIEGLSEHFLYFNDDVFLSSPVSPDLFFDPQGNASVHFSRARVAPGPPVAGEPASDSAGKNARALLSEVCDRRLSRKLFHAPFALRRSVSYEIEERWPDIVRRTRNAPFRRIDDVTLSGALHMNYAYATGRAVARGIRYRYVNVGAAEASSRLSGLIQDRDLLQTFCLNESTQDLPPEVIDAQVRDFLRRRFPDASTFEIPGA